jgi:hypothetical protein
MKNVHELQRLVSPAPKPQSLAWDGATLWMGSRETKRVYAINPQTWTVGAEYAAPGTPYGLVAVGHELRVLCSEGAEDHRIVRRLVPGTGFDVTWQLPCPDDTGSQLGFDGQRLHVSQWYPKKVVRVGDDGKIERVMQGPHGICGQVFVDGVLYLVTTDAEETNEYWLTRVDLKAAGSGEPTWVDVARIPFQARALAWDGTKFWTNHREQNQIVAFAPVE